MPVAHRHEEEIDRYEYACDTCRTPQGRPMCGWGFVAWCAVCRVIRFHRATGRWLGKER